LGSRDTPIRLGSDPSRVLTLRELNRATLARQLLLERRRLAPTTVIERLVGMQAQWPPAPHVGIWTRTTSFRRETLERALVDGAVVKATVMRQTLHLVTQRDYWLLRSAMSETNFPWESRLAKRLAPVARALADKGPVRTADAIVDLAEHDLGGLGGSRPPTRRRPFASCRSGTTSCSRFTIAAASSRRRSASASSARTATSRRPARRRLRRRVRGAPRQAASPSSRSRPCLAIEESSNRDR
jgi:hypothetical protein